jgi:hypothetical protein
MVRKYTKKAVTIKAIEWTGKNLFEVQSFLENSIIDLSNPKAADLWDVYTDMVRREGLIIITMEGEMKASVGDFIIRGVKGEHYPCKPDIFWLTYEQENERIV